MYTKITPKVGDKFRVVKVHDEGHWMKVDEVVEVKHIISDRYYCNENGTHCLQYSESDATSYLTTEYLEPVKDCGCDSSIICGMCVKELTPFRIADLEPVEEAFTGLSPEQLEQMQKIERAKKAINKPSYEQQEPVEEEAISGGSGRKLPNEEEDYITNIQGLINRALDPERMPDTPILDFINGTTKQTTMNKLTSALKRALSKDKQTLYKAGLIGQDLELTEEGQSAYVDALFNNEGDHKKAVAEMVDMASEDNE